VIELDRLDIRLGGSTVVRQVSLVVALAERVGIVGESGSGKTLTALATIGLLPDGATVTGRIMINGSNMANANERAWRRVRGRHVAMVFQEPTLALNPLMSIGEQVALPISRHHRLGRRQARLRAAALCASVSLEPTLLDRRPHQLSGGQRQRACLAIALAGDPTVLVADEPTTALDPTVQHDVLGLLDSLVERRRLSLLLVSHDLAVVASRTDRVVVLEHGRIAETSRSDVLRNGDAGSDAGRTLVAAARESDRRIRSLVEGLER